MMMIAFITIKSGLVGVLIDVEATSINTLYAD
jgi:hypothetical protein